MGGNLDHLYFNKDMGMWCVYPEYVKDNLIFQMEKEFE